MPQTAGLPACMASMLFRYVSFTLALSGYIDFSRSIVFFCFCTTMTNLPPERIRVELQRLTHASIQKLGSRATCGLAMHDQCADTCGNLGQYPVGWAEAPDNLEAVSRDM